MSCGDDQLLVVKIRDYDKLAYFGPTYFSHEAAVELVYIVLLRDEGIVRTIPSDVVVNNLILTR